MPTRRGVLAGVGAVLTAGCSESGSGGAATDRSTTEESGGTASDDPTDTTEESGGTASDDPTDTTEESGGTASDDPTDTTEESSGTASDDPTDTTEESGGALDLREANVVGVAVESVSGGHRFDVTLIHDDDGEDGYANWWAVETLDGTELGRRELRHAHGTREFTRSETVDVGEASCVVVRGHDQTHGYGGRAAAVSVERGAVRFVDQETERRAVAASTCP